MIKNWNYINEYLKFNYALKENGWIDTYCFKDSSLCYKVMEDMHLIGVFLFIPTKSNEFRLLINPNFLNKGYGTKITKEAIKLGFNELKFNEISLIVRKEHKVALDMYTKLGYKIIGETIKILENEPIQFFKMLKIKEELK
jgi:RimJ/RimL family protein N-acetyltransferase